MMRLPLGILSGVGFIGAGAILSRGEIVPGVTCNGRCRGAYPDWSSELLRELAARPDANHVEWADSD
jgi:hypothetical protein